MKKRIAVILMSTCISFTAVTGVYGADFSDGSGDISAIASQVVAQAEAKAQAYQDRKTEVEKAAVEYRASEIQKETTEIKEEKRRSSPQSRGRTCSCPPGSSRFCSAVRRKSLCMGRYQSYQRCRLFRIYHVCICTVRLQPSKNSSSSV